MTTRARTNKKTNVHLEKLESREAPTVGLSGAWQAALAQAQNRASHAIGAQVMPRALTIPRPGSASQRPAVSLGGAFGAAGRTPNAALALAQARRATLHMALPTPRTATPILARAQTARIVRSSMRVPVTVPISNAPTTPMTPPESPNVTPTSDAGTTPQPLPPNVSGALDALYQGYLKDNTIPPVGTGPGSIRVDGSNVGVSVHGNGEGEFSNFLSTLQNLGMEITASSDVTWTVNGMLPISALPTAAQTPQTRSITPLYTPIRF